MTAMSLHTCNKSGSNSVLPLCLQSLSEGDAVLFLEDGVYALLQEKQISSKVKVAVHLYALREDLAARGISDKIPSAVKVIAYKEFVALCLEYERVVNWI